MLDNTFVEEYIRIENNINTNEERVVFNREGLPVFTTPFLTGSRIVSDNLKDVSNNINPENVNIIIDSVVLISTNPNCQNYLPLKFEIGKRRFEFSTTQVSTLTDYKVVVNPPVNLNTVRNRAYTKVEEYAINQQELGIGITDNILESDGKVYMSNIADPELVAETDLTTRTNTVIDFEVDVLQIYANETLQIARVAGPDIIYREIENPLIDVINFEESANHIQTELFGNSIYTFYEEGTRTDLAVHTRDLGDWTLVITLAEVFDFIPDRIGFYNGDLFVGYERSTGRVVGSRLRSDDSNQSVTEFEFNITLPAVTTIKYVGVGGSDLSDPIVTVFTRTRAYSRAPSYSETKVTTIKSLLGEDIKRFRNQVYYASSTETPLFSFFNLDTLEISQFNINKLNPNIVVPRTGFNLINMTGDSIIIGGDAGPTDFSFTQFENTRPPRNVYKLAFNYDERPFPYQLASNRLNFKLSLPNGNPVSDLEIFKYVIDLRIRYSKSRQQPNRLLNDEENLTKRQREQRMRDMDLTTDRVLGLVSSDFDVLGFLKQ
jgi:hypothetical protein